MRFLKIFRILVKILFWGNSIALLISVLSPYINPKEFWAPAFFGLFFKIFFFLSLLFFICFILGRQWKYVLIATVLIILSLPSMSETISFHSAENIPGNGTISVLTYNMRAMDYCRDGQRDTVVKVYNQILALKPDVLFLQEYLYMKICPQMFRKLTEKGPYKFYYSDFGLRPNNTNIKYGGGIIILSRYPLFNFKKLFSLSNTNNGAISVDMKYVEDTVRLMNVHFQSIGLQKSEYEVSPQELEDPDILSFKASLKKFRSAFRKRAVQVELVKKAIEESPHKIILCGDFNDTPVSFTYHEMTKRLHDNFLKKGNGIGSTFAGPIPFLRIDYILSSPEIKVRDNEVLHWVGSDHFPVLGILQLK